MRRFLLLTLIPFLTAATWTVEPHGNKDAERAAAGLERHVGSKFIYGGCAPRTAWDGFPHVECFAEFNSHGQGWYVEYQALSVRRFVVLRRKGGCKFKPEWFDVTHGGGLNLGEPHRYSHCMLD